MVGWLVGWLVGGGEHHACQSRQSHGIEEDRRTLSARVCGPPLRMWDLVLLVLVTARCCGGRSCRR